MFTPRMLFTSRMLLTTFFEGDPAPAPAPAPAATPPKTFTQEEVNKFVSQRINEEHKKYQDASRKTIEQLESLQQQASTTEEQRSALQHQIDNLNAQFTTKEQQLTKDLKGWETKYTQDTKNLSGERDAWKSRFEQNVKTVDIVSSATSAKAYNPTQVQALLDPLTKVVEQSGPDGRPTGKYTSRVAWNDKDKDGNPITLQLSVEDAIKRMQEQPDLYGNLFRSEANGGLGGSTTGGRGAPAVYSETDVENMSMEDYAAKRTEVLRQVKG